MSISKELNSALKSKLGVSAMTISRRAAALAKEHGPMDPDEARWVLAHEAGIKLKDFGLSDQNLNRVRELRASMKTGAVSTVEKQVPKAAGPPEASAAPIVQIPSTPAAVFNSRDFHSRVVQSSRKLFVGGHPSDAIRRGFQSVNNRVKKLTASAEDGQALMGGAFAKASPPIQMTDLSSKSEKDEHDGARFLMMGGIAAMRNPRSHEDSWPTDADQTFVLEALALASLLHRFLDRCEEYAASP